jgi:hypothetical protein
MTMANQSSVTGFFRRYPLATISSGVWLVLLAIVGYRFGELGAAKELLSQKEAEGLRLEANARNAAGLDQQLELLNTRLRKLESKLIRTVDVGPNQQYFYDLEAVTGVKLSILRLAGAAKTKGTGGVFKSVGYNVGVEGRFPQVVAFLEALERGAHHYRLGDFALQRDSQAQAGGAAGGRVFINLNLELLASS